MTLDIHQIANHKIVEMWHLEDFYDLLQQLNASKMNLIERIYQVFAAADQLNLDEWIVYFTKEAQFRFGNTAPVAGHDKIRQVMAQFFSTIQTMHHEFVGMYEQDNVVIAEAEVTFTCLDNKVVQIPTVTVFRMQGDFMQDFRLYMDAAPIYTNQ